MTAMDGENTQPGDEATGDELETYTARINALAAEIIKLQSLIIPREEIVTLIEGRLIPVRQRVEEINQIQGERMDNMAAAVDRSLQAQLAPAQMQLAHLSTQLQSLMDMVRANTTQMQDIASRVTANESTLVTVSEAQMDTDQRYALMAQHVYGDHTRGVPALATQLASISAKQSEINELYTHIRRELDRWSTRLGRIWKFATSRPGSAILVLLASGFLGNAGSWIVTFVQEVITPLLGGG